MIEDYLSRIGNLIRDARKHRGWTQQQLADSLSTSQSAVNRIERGHHLEAEVLVAALDAVHRALAGGQRVRELLLGPSAVCAGVADQVADAVQVVLAHALDHISNMRYMDTRRALRHSPLWPATHKS